MSLSIRGFLADSSQTLRSRISQRGQCPPSLGEDMPSIPEPYASKIFYYTQYDVLTELSKGKSWTLSEIHPDGIVGFPPTCSN